MPARDDYAEFHREANEVRRIAAGIFDHGERELIIQFVDDCEKWFAASGGTTRKIDVQSRT
jgi:hypothetical protein